MSQLTIYLDDETQRKVELAARRESVSLSRWAREHLLKAAEAENASAWDHLSQFAGSVRDDDGFEVPSRERSHRPIPDFE